MDKLTIGLAMSCTAPVPDVLGGGAERLVTMLVDQNEIDQRVQFVVFSKKNAEAKRISQQYQHSIFVYIRPISLWDKIINECIKMRVRRDERKTLKRGYYFRIARQLKRIPVDFIVDENGYVSDIQYLTDSLGKEKVCAHIHWMVKPRERNLEYLYGSAIGVSRYITNIWKKNESDRDMILKTVYSAVDEKRFLPRMSSGDKNHLREQLGFKKEDCIFIYCGRMEVEKGPFILLKAFMELEIVNIGLIFVGGSDKKQTHHSNYHQQIIDQAKPDSRIKFTGYVDNKELYKYYQIADVQVIPTITEEAAGLVAMEGMLSGLPIIATNSGGMPEYLNKDCAIMIDNNSQLSDGLAKAMKKLIMDAALRKKMGTASLKNAKQYTQSKYYHAFIDAVHDIIHEYAERDKMRDNDR